MAPTCALLTPKDFANKGMIGAIIPKPTATKKDAKTMTPTSRGNSAKGLVKEFLDLFNNCPPKNIVITLNIAKQYAIAVSLLRENSNSRKSCEDL
jgi:hypothetical protein